MSQQAKVINFMGWRKTCAALSIVLLLGSIASLATKGIQFGLDFTGGSQVELGFDQPADLGKVRDVLAEQGLSNPVAILFGSDSEVLIRTQDALGDGAEERLEAGLAELAPEAELAEVRPAPSDQARFSEILVFEGVSARALGDSDLFNNDYYGESRIITTESGQVEVSVQNALDDVYSRYLIGRLEEATGAGIDLRRSEFVGPQVGAELRDQGGLGMLFALAVVMIYVAIRFQYKFSVGAVAALIHDVIIVLGVFSFLQLDFDLTVLAAILAVIGYSLNDTIVVFDRIRENFRRMRRGSTEEVINTSLTQMLERTLLTSLTTLMVLVVLYIFGGELINNFSFALIVGVVVGTYSSIYVSANTLTAMRLTREDLMPPQKEGEEQEELTP